MASSSRNFFVVHSGNFLVLLVREGVRAYLADKYEEVEVLQLRRRSEGWTSFQCADHVLLQRLSSIADQLSAYRDRQLRREVRDAFREYAYQWY